MDSLEVVQTQGMGLQLDLVAIRTICKGDEILIDYGKTQGEAMTKHNAQWESRIEAVKLEHEKDEAMQKKQHWMEREE